MSSREPLWYCHECHAEMRPLMVPDPHCASCNGTFVEKMENPADDPREFAHGFANDAEPFGAEHFLFALQNLLRASAPGLPRSPPPGPPRSPPTMGGGSGYTIHINRTSAPGQDPRTRISTGPPRTGDIPLLSEFASRNGARPGLPSDVDVIAGPLMFQYLLAMLSQPGRTGPMPEFFEGLMPGGPEAGRFGDYVFNQEALDQIITQLMENSAAHPVPASEDVMQKLPREILEEGSPLLEKDCAVCKEQFALGTEDPNEQIIVTLPCRHPFHEPCIMPWLKSSGTCPVCRYQLVPQPSNHAPGPGPPAGSGSGDNPNPSSSRPGSPRAPGSFGGSGERRNDGAQGQQGGGGPAGILGGLFNLLGTAAHNALHPQNNNSNNSSSNNSGTGNDQHTNSNEGGGSSGGNVGGNTQRRTGSRRNSADDLPGSWNDVD